MSERARAAIAIGLEGVMWWALMVGVWQLTLSGTTLAEIYCEVAAAFIAALAAVTTRRAAGGRWLPSWRWARWLPVVLVSVVADTARVLALAARHVRRRDAPGEFAPVQLRLPRVADPEAHRAYATLAVTCTPGSIVYDSQPESHRLFRHTLVSGPPDLEQTVAR